MPAADITNVSVTFGFGVKREEFGPTKKAEATISASVPEGHDGVIALNYVAKIARDKVGELLGLGVKADLDPPVVVEQPDTGRGQTLPPAGDTGETQPARRKRRTNAEIAADAAAAEQASASAQPASEPGTDTEAGSPDTGDATGDEWDTPAAAAQVTDEALLSATSATAGRIGDRQPILDLKETYRNLDKFPADQKFGVTDIPQEFRQDYLTKLAALPVKAA